MGSVMDKRKYGLGALLFAIAAVIAFYYLGRSIQCYGVHGDLAQQIGC